MVLQLRANSANLRGRTKQLPGGPLIERHSRRDHQLTATGFHESRPSGRLSCFEQFQKTSTPTFVLSPIPKTRTTEGSQFGTIDQAGGCIWGQ